MTTFLTGSDFTLTRFEISTKFQSRNTVQILWCISCKVQLFLEPFQASGSQTTKKLKFTKLKNIGPKSLIMKYSHSARQNDSNNSGPGYVRHFQSSPCTHVTSHTMSSHRLAQYWWVHLHAQYMSLHVLVQYWACAGLANAPARTSPVLAGVCCVNQQRWTIREY